MKSGCFACHPGPNTGTGARALCWAHKKASVLSDGALLYGMLARAEPPDAQLEGSSLGWLYSPVFVVDARGIRCRAWTSFAGGGMAVLEDRFGAEDPFEFWLYERDDLFGELLGELSARVAAGHAGPLPTALEQLTAPSREAFTIAQEMWFWHREVKARHEALGRWPASFEELDAILTNVHPHTPPSVTDAADFIEGLRRLALRGGVSSDRAPAYPRLLLAGPRWLRRRSRPTFGLWGRGRACA